MSVSKFQKAGFVTRCHCGCDKTFSAFPVYQKNTDDVIQIEGPRGGKLYIPMYIRGHHPKSKKNHFGEKPAWNAGMKKGDHPSLDRMGFQTQHGEPKIRILTYTKEGQAFLKFILDRDKCCVECGSEEMLQTHHIEHQRDAPHRIMDPDNVITLCTKCHGRIHALDKHKNQSAAP